MRKRFIAAAAAAAIVAGGVGVASASATPSPAPLVAVAQDAATDGQDLFTGLFFGIGPVADDLVAGGLFAGDDTGEFAHNATAEGRAAIAEIVALVEEASPEFFAGFASDVRSGDPRLVEAAVAEAVEELTAVVEVEQSEDFGSGALCIVNVAAAANVAVALNVASVANVLTQVNFWIEAPPANGAGLSQEEAVALLTAQLAA
ncbi:hypothetical protein ACFVUW_12470 [Streptomyces xiamenensis]|uniref:hypothetical protein n=1 Tax=Streptomyces xiamenensis TaxID=408015 RepID=UPI0036ED5110